MGRARIQDPLMKHKFNVSLPGLPNTMGFAKVSGLKREINVVEYNEGGYNATHKLPGREKTDKITLERGMYADTSLENMIKKSLTDANFRQTMIIEQKDSTGKTVRTWKLAEAWVSSWEGSEFDAGSDDVAIEKITVEFEYYL